MPEKPHSPDGQRRLRTEKRYVAICDVLGLKEILRSKGLHWLVERYGKLLKFTAFNQVAHVKKATPERRGPWRRHSISRHVVFSDTILIWTTSSPRTREFTVWPSFFFPM